jgi:hypothetical protein
MAIINETLPEFSSQRTSPFSFALIICFCHIKPNDSPVSSTILLWYNHVLLDPKSKIVHPP